MKKRRMILSVLLSSSLVCVAPNCGAKTLAKENETGVSGANKIFAETINNNLKDINNPELSRSYNMNYFIDGYTTANVNVRKEPSMDSEILEVFPFNKYVQFFQYDDEWVSINYCLSNEDEINVITAYIKAEYISTKEYPYTSYLTPNNAIKSFMDYKCITSKSSKQYKLQTNYAYTGNYGIRQVNWRYCVAVGSAFTTEIGTYIDLVLENGEIIPCILADCKDDEDTDINNIITHDGSLAEFVVDTDFLSKTVKYTGDISNATENWKSKIIEVRVYERKVEL